ncbi:transposase [Streptomyces althioticus]
MIRRHELTDQKWELPAPLIPRAATGRPRVPDRQVINGMAYKIRTGISWRDLPERYGPWQTVCTRFRRYAIDGVFTRALQQIQAQADAAGDIDWLVQTDSTIVRATSTPPPPAEKGDPPAGRPGRSHPRPIPRRTDYQDPPRLRRQRPSSGPPRHTVQGRHRAPIPLSPLRIEGGSSRCEEASGKLREPSDPLHLRMDGRGPSRARQRRTRPTLLRRLPKARSPDSSQRSRHLVLTRPHQGIHHPNECVTHLSVSARSAPARHS